MQTVAKEAKDGNGHSDIPVAIDGTLQKREHTSLNGAVIARNVDTSKVIDASILSRFSIEIFQCSESLHGLRYAKFLGDGDSRAYKAVNEMQPYGDTGIEREKLECIGHVEKRMGTRPRALKLKLKGKKLNDKKTLGGRGRLTDAEIDKLQRYYGLAIRNNTDSINSMKRAIWATYFHKASTDAYPQHGMCPTNEDTWCGYYRAITTGEVYKHKNTLPSEVLHCIKDVYRELSTPNLLAKCLHGKTQNCNESVNSTIWSRIPKNVFVQLGTLKTGILEAIASYNQGNISKYHVLETGIFPGFYTAPAMEAADRERLRKANYDILRNSKEARIKRRHKKCILEDTLAEERKKPKLWSWYALSTKDMHLIYGLTEGNAGSTEGIHERYSQTDASNCLIFANLYHNLCEYGSFRGNKHSEGGPRYPTHFVSRVEQSVLDTVRRKQSTMLGNRVIRGLLLPNCPYEPGTTCKVRAHTLIVTTLLQIGKLLHELLTPRGPNVPGTFDD
ncbi:uncharacterized protein TNCV_4829371 [Trichonephila clavipes]|nr:uncharacterized protein TNCV_4829371 [Trichonephila clavipes]